MSRGAAAKPYRLAEVTDFVILRAGRADVDEIAGAHLDSIRSLGPLCYDEATVCEWGARVEGALYLSAMDSGEAFFVARGDVGGKSTVLGFSSHRIDEGVHGASVYVRGKAARLGIGSALYKAAEAAAIASGATSIHLSASLVAVEFYKAHGFEEVARGEHPLPSGRSMACVFMRKDLAASRR